MKNYKEVYVVLVGIGDYEDYFEDIQFATFSKEKAKNWVEKYNRLIDLQRTRIEDKDYENNPDYDKPPFLYDLISYHYPRAMMHKTKIRYE